MQAKKLNNSDKNPISPLVTMMWKARDRLEKPDEPPYAYFCLTRSCPLECDFCYTSSGPNLSWTDIPSPLIMRVFEELKGIEWIFLTGGEPVARSGFWEILQKASKTAKKVFVFTNLIPLLSPQSSLPKTIYQELKESLSKFPSNTEIRIGFSPWHIKQNKFYLEIAKQYGKLAQEWNQDEKKPLLKIHLSWPDKKEGEKIAKRYGLGNLYDSPGGIFAYGRAVRFDIGESPLREHFRFKGGIYIGNYALEATKIPNPSKKIGVYGSEGSWINHLYKGILDENFIGFLNPDVNKPQLAPMVEKFLRRKNLI